MDYSEEVANIVLVHEFGESGVVYNSKQSDGEVDFYVEYDNSKRCVEVTSITDSARLKLIDAIDKNSPNYFEYCKSLKLKRGWVIRLNKSSKVKRLVVEVEDILLDVEQRLFEGSLNSDDLGGYTRNEFISELFRKHSIQSLFHLQLREGPGYILETPVEGSFVGPEKIIDPVLEEVRKKDNQRKLKFKPDVNFSGPIFIVYIDIVHRFDCYFTFSNIDSLSLPSNAFYQQDMEVWVIAPVNDKDIKLIKCFSDGESVCKTIRL